MATSNRHAQTSPIINAHLKYALFDGVGRTACLCRFSVKSDGVGNRPCPPTDSQLDYSTYIHQNALSNGNSMCYRLNHTSERVTE
ncbi:hypothetical protein KSF78_0008051 [Schistosoma japonicum]|nr:hypothetical protein KSF78_0008051 [Schistosoma japonicum]